MATLPPRMWPNRHSRKREAMKPATMLISLLSSLFLFRIARPCRGQAALVGNGTYLLAPNDDVNSRAVPTPAVTGELSTIDQSGSVAAPTVETGNDNQWHFSL